MNAVKTLRYFFDCRVVMLDVPKMFDFHKPETSRISAKLSGCYNGVFSKQFVIAE
jgi:hypothetical protein